MKLYVCDLEYAKKHEAELRKLRLAGNMIAMHADCSRQALMRHYRTLANFYIADHGEFAFSGCYILYNKRPDVQKVIEILDENAVRYRFAYPYTNACGGLDVKYESDASLNNDFYTYVLAFDSAEQKERVQRLLEPWCRVENDGEIYYLIFQESSRQRALEAVMIHEKIEESQLIFLYEE